MPFLEELGNSRSQCSGSKLPASYSASRRRRLQGAFDRVRGAEAPSAQKTVRTGPYRAPHARRIDQSSADQCKRFLAERLVCVVRRSNDLVDACHALCVGPSSICADAVQPVFTSRPGERPLK